MGDSQNTTDVWGRQWRFWRIQIRVRALRHNYPVGDHRVVIQPALIVDYGRVKG